jgi:hypothetical protein
MDNRRGDDRFGDDRWGGRDERSWRSGERSWRDEDRGWTNRGGDRWTGRNEERGWSRGDDDWSRRGHEGEDRGFFERAGEEIRSWFGGDEDRGREGWREEGRSGRYQGYAGEAGGGDAARYRGGSHGGPARSDETFGGSGFGGSPDHGRRFDRIDAGSTGTHGAHPMSSPVGRAYDPSYGGYQSSARDAAILRESGRDRGGSRSFDPHYAEWRQRQMEELDRDYDEYRRENQSRFEQEFGGWRQKRQTQRQSLGSVTEHMEVVGQDGSHVGTVDKVAGDRIILTKSDETAGGHHHSVPCSWIERVDDKVVINRSAEDAMKAWRDEDRSRALFERPEQGSAGPHNLNRSFSGTYDKND